MIAVIADADLHLWSSDPARDIMVLEDESKLGLTIKGGELNKNKLVSDADPAYRPAPTMRIRPASPEFVQRNGSCA